MGFVTRDFSDSTSFPWWTWWNVTNFIWSLTTLVHSSLLSCFDFFLTFCPFSTFFFPVCVQMSEPLLIPQLFGLTICLIGGFVVTVSPPPTPCLIQKLLRWRTRAPAGCQSDPLPVRSFWVVCVFFLFSRWWSWFPVPSETWCRASITKAPPVAR